LTDAFDAITDEAIGSVPQSDVDKISLHVSLAGTPSSPNVMLEWRGVKPGNRNRTLNLFHDQATVHMALAAKIIEAHEGRIEHAADAIRVWLPLSEIND
ncbi:MAG: hypothetical protein ACMG6H_05485, partial [Acidobacteriota bacterium]